MQAIEDKLEENQDRLNGALADQQQYKNFTKKERVEEVQQVATTEHNTLCQTCHHVCHAGCGINFQGKPSGDELAGCACMDSTTKTCRQCPNRCGPASHYHAHYKIVKASKTVEQVLQSIKARYDAAGQAKGAAESQIGTCRGTLALMKQEQARKMDEIKRLCREIQGICRHFQFVDELKSVLDSLEMEKRQLRSTSARQAAEATIRGLKAFIDDLCKAVPPAPVRAPTPGRRRVTPANESGII